MKALAYFIAMLQAIFWATGKNHALRFSPQSLRPLLQVINKPWKVKEHYETEREGLVSKFNELKDMLQEERKETDSLRKKIRSMQQ